MSVFLRSHLSAYHGLFTNPSVIIVHNLVFISLVKKRGEFHEYAGVD